MLASANSRSSLFSKRRVTELRTCADLNGDASLASLVSLEEENETEESTVVSDDGGFLFIRSVHLIRAIFY